MPDPHITGNQPKRINIEKGVFQSGSPPVYYYINLEAMSFARLKRFAELLPSIIYGKSYLELANFIHSLKVKMTTGEETLKQTYFEVATALTEWDQYALGNASTFYETTMDNMLRFCALFIVEAGEDMCVVDDILTEKKITNWKSDCNMLDFFLLTSSQLPKYRELLTTLLEEQSEKEKQSLKIPVN